MWQALMLTTMEMIPFNPLNIPSNEGFINPSFIEVNKMQKCKKDVCHER